MSKFGTRFAPLLVSDDVLALSAALLGLVSGTPVLQMLVWGWSISTVLVYHSTFAVNSLAHRFGSRPFETRDNSRNNPFVAAIMMGEGFHNNHPRFPTSASFAMERRQVDVGYWIILFFKRLGLVWDVKVARPLAGTQPRTAERPAVSL